MSDTPETTPETPEADSRKAVWMRGLHMLIVLVLTGIAGYVVTAATVIQFFWQLFTATKNDGLVRFGRSLGQWFNEAIAFLTGVSEEKPFPYNGWPSDNP
ncbi:MAG: DUF4389 domain-containing protein [Rhodobacteraceae bacterium]|nr:DUF4389 domain-containing protein [Paracoccaceae bacterium]